ncbi:hypothetical protein U9M48_034069 [Paspalum notatum var. saurae]|uniref:Leucine-rich repeat-containing N-terminal plant-type domain-containing protein n=1 Tax=Paspalum notatum var. saurae TaxID=547442 RepID=A0AAQ3X6H8_PASNO
MLWVICMLPSMFYLTCGCVPEERLALLHLRSSLMEQVNLTYDDVMHSWGQSHDCCSWERVTCNNDSARVSGLELFGMHDSEFECWNLNLTTFSQFHELERLDLGFNSACLQNFDALEGLAKLQDLDLYGNRFIGKNDDIMVSLGKLTSLQFLGLEETNVSGPLQNIGETLNNFGALCVALSCIYCIYMLYVYMTAFRNLKKLRSLFLATNQLNGSIPASLFELPHLEVLDLSGNLLQGHIPISSSSSILTSLKSLKLSENNLEGTFDFFWLRNCTMLKIIDLSGNAHLSVDVGLRGLVPSFQLMSLKLSRCNLDKSITEGPNFLGTQRHLEILELSENKLTGSIPNWILQQSNLQVINISMNLFEGQLPTNLSLVFPNLTVLDASNNIISGDLALPPCDFKRVLVMDLSNNKFSGKVPACLFSCVRKILELSNNNLEGPIFGGSNYLSTESIYLGSNNFQGELPSNLSGEVEILDLHDNRLFGKLNTSVWDLPSLLALAVARNRLTGEIYPSICKLTSLQFLDISDNNFAGLVPNCNSKLKLQFLNTSGNSLSGFPSYFFLGSYVTALDLRYNQFIDTLDWIKYLPQVRLLLLSGNKFEGHITQNLCHLQNLNVIDFSHNKLSGSIPHCVGNISFGYHEDDLPSTISGLNGLTYGFPDVEDAYSVDVQYELPGFTFSTKGKLYTYGHGFFNLMFGIDLSANMLSGEIPWELGNLSHVKSLNLSHNIFTGQIPHALANMSAIESLDLSHNELSGPIPWELTQLWSLEVFSVAYNNLSGCIPDSGQFASFGMDSYQGNKNLTSTMSLGNGCSAALAPVAPVLEEDAGAWSDDLILYVVSASSFVLAFWATVAFSFCHSYGRSSNYSDIPASWGQSGDCCSWERVTCNKDSVARVSELNLADLYDPTGMHPIAEDEYQSLNLTVFSPFRELQLLDLSLNYACIQNFDDVENLNNLQELDLSYNQLSGSIPSSLFELPFLEYLDLSGNLLHGYIPINSSSNLSLSLQTLKLSENKLSGMFDLFFLRNCTMLGTIDLSKNADLTINVMFRRQAPPFQLRSLGLSGCNLDNSIIMFLGTQRHLQVLDLSSNNLTASVLQWIFTNEATLSFLDLSNNLLVGPLDPLWQHQSNLSFINISMNHFEGQLATNFSSVFPNLIALDASHNNISGHIPLSLCNVSGMAFVDLSDNKLTGELPTCLFTNSPMLQVYLDSNQFNGTLTNNLSARSIQTMDLHDNKLSGNLSVSNWDLGSSSGQFYLNVASNNLTGEIDHAICKFANLAFLDLSNNKFVGSLPECSGNLTGLIFLNISVNSLSGFPSVFLNGSNIVALDLRHNKFEGTLDWIQYLSNIQMLLLGGNLFEGHISQNLCHLWYFTIIDFSHNSLSGSLPHCIGGMLFGYHAKYSDLISYGSQGDIFGGTRFANSDPGDPFSRYIGDYYFQMFSLFTKGNRYTYSRSFVSVMFAIDLSGNTLSGEIPREVGNLSHVKSLNLSHNSFTGRIPATLEHMSALESLDLSHNDLTGPIPLELTRLSSLEVFSVAYNNLSGCIPDYGQFTTFGMDSYQGNKNLKNMSLGYGCSAGSSPVSPTLEEVVKAFDDLILYVVTSTSFVLAFWFTVAFSFCHPVQFALQRFTFSTKEKLYTYGRGFFNLMFGIDLSANMLSVEIPWELGNLSHVKSLNLSHNFFNGRIPPAIANMSALSLDFSHNELSGPIPRELTRLWSLEVFSVAFNNLSGCIPDSGQFASFGMDSYQGNKNLKITMSLGNGCSAALAPVAPSMFCITCGCVAEERNAVMDIRSSLMQRHPCFVGRSEDCCSWEGVTCNKASTRVTELHLSSMYYYPNPKGRLECWNLNSTVFSPFNELQLLDLSSLEGLTKLRYLDLSYNDFIGNDGIMRFIGKSSSLEVIDIYSTNMNGTLQNKGTGNMLVDILFTPALFVLILFIYMYVSILLYVTDFKNLKNLRELNLGYNQLSESIPPSLLELPHLEYLYLSGNLFQGYIPISSSSNLSLSLQTLELSENKLNGTFDLFWLRKCTMLKTIKLSKNTGTTVSANIARFSGCNLDNSVIAFLGTQRHLQYLDLSSIKLTTGHIYSILNWISTSYAALVYLDISNNLLMGSLGPMWWHQSNISYINISMNHFEGQLPTNISSVFPNLETLDASYNNFTGHIPLSLCNVSSMSLMDLSNNKFTEVPTCVFSGPYLILVLSNNNLGGSNIWWG